MADQSIDQSFLNISIKDEPIDDYGEFEYPLHDITIKEEPDGEGVTEDPLLIEADADITNNVSNDNDFNNSPMRNTAWNKDSPVTRKIFINGEEKTCVLVKVPQANRSSVKSVGQLKENLVNTLNSSPSTSATLKVQCPRCKNSVAMEKFRQHIDVCPPRCPRKLTTKKPHEESTSIGKATDVTWLSDSGNGIRSGEVSSSPSQSNAMLSETINVTPDYIKDLYRISEPISENNSRTPAGSSSRQEPAWVMGMRTRSKSVSYSRERTYRRELRSDTSRTEDPISTNDKSPSVDKVPERTRGRDKRREFSPTRTRSKSCPRILNNGRRGSSSDTDSRSTGGLLMRTRSQSRLRSTIDLKRNEAMDSADEESRRKTFSSAEDQLLSIHKNKIITEEPEKTDHASQMAYYQKFLEIRRKSVSSNKIDLSSRGINESEIIIDDHRPATDNDKFVPNDNQQTDEPKDTEEAIEDDNSLLADSTFSCSICSFTTDKQRSLKDHERNHRKGGYPIFKCIYCDQKYTRYALYLHIQSVHPGQKFYVSEEGEKLIEPNTLNIDKVEEHEKTSAFKCSKCSFSGETEVILAEHLKTHCEKENSSLSSSKITCTHCSYTTSFIHDMVKHENYHKTNPAILQCSWCDFKLTPRALAVHERKCSNRPIDSPSKYKCRKCSKSFQSKTSFDVHQREHAVNLEVLPCPNNCGFKATSGMLKTHLNKSCKHNTNSTEAVIKDDAVQTTTELKVSQTKQKKFNCWTCPFSTNLRIKLKFHIKKQHAQVKKLSDHQERRRFKCSICSVTATNQHNLDRHMKCHKSNMPDSSSNPGSDCAPNTHSNISATIHKKRCDTTPLRPTASKYKCPRCSFSCNIQMRLKIHLKIHKRKRGGKVRKCGQCSFTTAHLGSYNQHVRSHKTQSIGACKCGFKSTISQLYKHQLVCKAGIIESKEKIASQEKTAPDAPLLHCSKCKFTTDMQSELELHLKKPHVNVFHCKECSVIATSENVFKRHMRDHELNYSVKKCPYCNYKSIPKCLYRHMKEHISEPPVKCVPVPRPQKQIEVVNKSNKLFKCKKCSFVTTHPNGLNRHSMSHKLRQPILKCPYCTFKSTSNTLQRHVAEHKGGIRRRASETKKSEVDQDLDQSLEVDQHASTDTSRDFTFQSTPSTLQSAEHSKEGIVLNSSENDTVEKFFNCTFCSAQDMMLAPFKRHVKTHLQGQPIKQCTVCTFKSTPHCLQHHVWKAGHYKKKKWLKVIQQRHSAEDSKEGTESKKRKVEETLTSFKQKCTNIEGVFNSSENDSVEKLIDCALCSAQGLSLSRSKQHMKAHIQGQPIKQCSVCSFKSTPRYFLYHVYKTGHYTRNPSLKVDQRASTGASRDFTFKSTPSTRQKHSAEHSKEGIRRRASEPNKSKVEETVTSCKQTCSKTEGVLNSSESDRAEKLFNCTLCSAQGMTPGPFKRHKKTHLLGQPIIQCAVCTFKSTPRKLQDHVMKAGHGVRKNKHKYLKVDQHASTGTSRDFTFKTTPSTLQKHSAADSKEGIRRRASEPKKSKVQETLTSCKQECTNSSENDTVEKIFNCTLCSAQCIAPGPLKRHEKTHLLGQPILQCTVCTFKSTPRNLQEHVMKAGHGVRKKKHKDLDQSLRVDQHSFTNTARYLPKPREKQMRPKRAYNRQKTGRFISNLKGSKVKKVIRGVSGPASRHFQCPLCTFSTDLRIKLNVHTRKLHSTSDKSNRASSLNILNKATKRKKDLNTTNTGSLNQNEEDANLNPTGLLKFNSDDIKIDKKRKRSVPKKYSTSLELNWKPHMKEHNISNPSILQSAFKRTSDMMKMSHSKKCATPSRESNKRPQGKLSFNCSKCSFTTTFPAALILHEKNGHTEEKVKNKERIKNVQCEYCSFTTYWQYLMDRHVESHTVLKLPILECSACNFRSTPAAFQAHIKSCRRSD